MSSDNIKTYAVGNGEITLSDSDAEELRIILQTEHVRNVMASIVRNNIGDLNLPGKRCERSLVDWLTDAFGEYITIDPETDIHVTETAEDMMFGRAEELGWYGEKKAETLVPAEDEPTEECRIVGCHGEEDTIIIQRYGKNDYGAWFTNNPDDKSSGSSVRGTLVDIIGDVYQCID